MNLLKNLDLKLSWLIATIAMSGSLYFSEVMNFTPCTLCWYQRILMYPLVLLLGIASLRKDTKVIYYALPISVVGIFVSGYHYLLQKTDLFNSFGCSSGVPCSGEYINWLGFITIPFLALIAFSLVSLILWIGYMLKENEE